MKLFAEQIMLDNYLNVHYSTMIMTIKGLNTIILELFVLQDMLSSEDVIKHANLNLGSDELNVNMCRAAFDELEKNGIIKKLNDDNFVLMRPLADIQQTIIVDSLLGLAIAKVCNQAAELATGQKCELINPLNISDKDIEFLVQIVDSGNQNGAQKFDESSWLKNL